MICYMLILSFVMRGCPAKSHGNNICSGLNKLIKTNINIIIFTFLSFVCNVSYADSSNATIRILVTGFEPFGTYETNPTNELSKHINNLKEFKINNIKLKAVTLPVTYYASWKKLEDELRMFSADYIISFGYAPGSQHVRLESTAKNHDRGYRDNQNKKHLGKIIADGPDFYSSELPISNIEKQLKSKGIPVLISSDAGGYLCNHIYYLERHYTSKKRNIKSGFFHVPDWPVLGEKGLWLITKTILNEIAKEHSKNISIKQKSP